MSDFYRQILYRDIPVSFIQNMLKKMVKISFFKHMAFGDCSRATGFIQPVHDGVMQGFVDGLQRGLHATYPMQDAHGSALASVPDRHSFASCDSAGCPAPPHSRWRAAVCHQETSGPFPR